MNTIEISELQKNLGDYLAQVKSGKQFAIEENDKIIAQILPFESENGLSEDEKSLVADGLMRLPITEEAEKDFWETDLSEVSLDKIVETIRSERDEN